MLKLMHYENVQEEVAHELIVMFFLNLVDDDTDMRMRSGADDDEDNYGGKYFHLSTTLFDFQFILDFATSVDFILRHEKTITSTLYFIPKPRIR